VTNQQQATQPRIEELKLVYDVQIPIEGYLITQVAVMVHDGQPIAHFYGVRTAKDGTPRKTAALRMIVTVDDFIVETFEADAQRRHDEAAK
jgi:hypothetical protein